MDLKNYLFIAFVLLVILFINKKMIREEKRYLNIGMVLTFIVVNFSLRVNYNQYDYFTGLENYIYIPIIIIVMISIYIATIKHQKITLDNVLISIILVTFLFDLYTDKIISYVRFWTLFSTYFAIFIIGLIYKNIQGYQSKKILDMFSYIAIFNGILGILQYITNKKLLIGSFNDDIFYSQGGEYVKRVVGLAATNNSGGNLAAILFAIVFYNFLREKSLRNILALILTSIFSILTLTRIGYFTIIVELILYFIFTKWGSMDRTARKFIIGISSVLVVLVIFYVFREKIIFILFEQRGDTASARGDQFEFVFSNIVRFSMLWLGIGTGQYRYYAFDKLGYWDIDIHSQYINLLVENGVVMLLLFLVFNISIFIRAIKHCDDKLERVFVLSLFVGNIICVNFNPNQYYAINNWLYYLLMYCLVYKRKDASLSIRNDSNMYDAM